MTDTTQFEAFMRNYQDMVYSTAIRLLANQTDAEDVTQTVFLKAFEHFESLSQSATAGGWLKTVATNLCLNQLSRYRSRWRFFSEMRSEDEGDRDYVESVRSEECVIEQMAEADYHRLIEEAIQKLPAGQRVPLVLFHFEDLPYEEIARRLSVSLSKVKTDIHRGRLALKNLLRERLSGEGRWEESAPGPSPKEDPVARKTNTSVRPGDKDFGLTSTEFFVV